MIKLKITGSRRIKRGGSWGYGGYDCAVPYGSGGIPDNRYSGIGFRPVRRIYD